MTLDKETSRIIEELYIEMYDKLCIYAVNALGDRDLAEEAVQDTFRLACMKADELLKSSNRRGWLMNTLKNVIRNYKKSRARFARLLEALNLLGSRPTPRDGKSEVELEQLYVSVLGQEDFELLKYVMIENNTMRDAADKFGISVEACKKRIQRAKQKLRAAIEKNL